MRRIISLYKILPIVIAASVLPSAAVQVNAKETTESKNPSSSQKAKGMIVSYNQTGGFAGIHKGGELDTSKMDKDQAQELERLVKETGILKESEVRKKNPHAADVFIYQFTVTDNGSVHKAIFDDTTLPENYRPLLKFMTSNAQNKS